MTQQIILTPEAERIEQKKFAVSQMSDEDWEDAKYNQRKADSERYNAFANGAIKHHHKKWKHTGINVRRNLYVPLSRHGTSKNVNIYFNVNDRMQRKMVLDSNEIIGMNESYLAHVGRNVLNARSYLEERARRAEEIGARKPAA